MEDEREMEDERIKRMEIEGQIEVEKIIKRRG